MTLKRFLFTSSFENRNLICQPERKGKDERRGERYPVLSSGVIKRNLRLAFGNGYQSIRDYLFKRWGNKESEKIRKIRITGFVNNLLSKWFILLARKISKENIKNGLICYLILFGIIKAEKVLAKYPEAFTLRT